MASENINSNNNNNHNSKITKNQNSDILTDNEHENRSDDISSQCTDLDENEKSQKDNNCAKEQQSHTSTQSVKDIIKIYEPNWDNKYSNLNIPRKLERGSSIKNNKTTKNVYFVTGISVIIILFLLLDLFFIVSRDEDRQEGLEGCGEHDNNYCPFFSSKSSLEDYLQFQGRQKMMSGVDEKSEASYASKTIITLIPNGVRITTEINFDSSTKTAPLSPKLREWMGSKVVTEMPPSKILTALHDSTDEKS